MTEDHFSPGSPWGTLRPGPWNRFWMRLSRGLGFAPRVVGSWLPSRFALLARRLARIRLAGPVDTVVWGLRLRLHPGRSVSEARILFLPWHWDHIERLRLGPWVRPGFTFVDVGANVGGYTLWISSLTGGDGRVVAVEPDPALVRQLRYNLRANGLEGSVRVVEAAVGAAPGQGRLIRNFVNSGENRLAREPVRGDGSGGAGPLGSVDDGAAPMDDEVLSVRVRPLASIVREAGLERIDCLKVDVEGHERDVLEPFLAEAPPHLRPRLLLVEIKPGEGARAMESWILSRGYRLECRTPLNGLFRREDAVTPAAPARTPALRARRSAPPAHARSGGTGRS